MITFTGTGYCYTFCLLNVCVREYKGSILHYCYMFESYQILTNLSILLTPCSVNVIF